MEPAKSLLKQLTEYGSTDFYPFHMPGHKRNLSGGSVLDFPNPFSVDITEIEGFDNLHHPEGILKRSMEWAASVYGASRTYYLVNGSSCGVLSAICGTVRQGGRILMSRNCHKSAYHGVFLNHLSAEYIYPQIVPEFGIQGGLLPADVEKRLKNDPGIEAVLVVSPTYDGIVSDIGGIAEAAHRQGVPLIVDEAHGAHFPFGADFPISALESGADVVIQSLHKTLPSLTQTAVMHVKDSRYVEMERIDRYVHIFQSSSPSYVFLASIENCLRWMTGEGRGRMTEFAERLKIVRAKLRSMKRLRLLPEALKGSFGVFDIDPAKIVVCTGKAAIDGAELECCLRTRYHLELEMCGPEYVTAIAAVLDTEEGLKRLVRALRAVDRKLEGDLSGERASAYTAVFGSSGRPEICMTIGEAMDSSGRRSLRLEDSRGKICGEFVYLYPPGIPIIAPGERLEPEIVEKIIEYKRRGLSVEGPADLSVEHIWVIDE